MCFASPLDICNVWRIQHLDRLVPATVVSLVLPTKEKGAVKMRVCFIVAFCLLGVAGVDNGCEWQYSWDYTCDDIDYDYPVNCEVWVCPEEEDSTATTLTPTPTPSSTTTTSRA